MPTVTTLVVLTIVPYEGRYLLVEELDGSFYLPAGRVEPGESLVAAAIRETAEETGVAVRLRGLLGIDHRWLPGSPPTQRLRFAFAGIPATSAPPKGVPDRHSRGASWFARDEIPQLPLRDPEVVDWIAQLESGRALLPCEAYAWRG